jgi:hypothetical protein
VPQRRKRLWAQIINDNPSYSEAQIVARMEQFGLDDAFPQA